MSVVVCWTSSVEMEFRKSEDAAKQDLFMSLVLNISGWILKLSPKRFQDLKVVVVLLSLTRALSRSPSCR